MGFLLCWVSFNVLSSGDSDGRQQQHQQWDGTETLCTTSNIKPNKANCDVKFVRMNRINARMNGAFAIEKRAHTHTLSLSYTKRNRIWNEIPNSIGRIFPAIHCEFNMRTCCVHVSFSRSSFPLRSFCRFFLFRKSGE